MKNKFLLFILLGVMIFSNSYSQQDVNGWYWLNGQPTGNTLNWVKVINSTTIYAVGGRGTFLKSTDGGDVWSVNSQCGSPDNSSTGNLATRDLNTAWFFDANTGIVAGATQTAPSGVATGLVNRTTNGGSSWNYIQFNDTTGTVNDLYFIDANTGYLTGGNRARFFKTEDGGLTWQDQSFSPIVPALTYNSVFAIDTSHIFLGTSSGKICTHLPGQDSAWKLKSLPGTTSNTITDILFKDANTGYACGNGNYFAYTLDGGVTWTQSNAPASVGQRSLSYSGGILYMGGSYTEIYKSTDNGVTWTAVNFVDNSNPNQPAQFIIYGINANGNDIAVVGTAGIMNITNDGGTTWRNKNYSVTGVGGTTLYSSMLVRPYSAPSDGSSDYEVWLGCNGGAGLLHSINSGANWTTVAASHTRSIYDIEFVNQDTGYICGGFPNNPFGVGEISKTTDGGATWTALTLPALMNISQINAVSFPNANTGYAAAFMSIFDPGLVWKTTDGGTTWNSQSFDSPPGGSIINVQMINVDTGYALANSLYTTTNGGTNWVKTTNAYVLATSYSNMFVYNKDIIYLNGNGTSGAKKVIRTLDGGQTWSDLTGNLLSTFTAFRTYWLNNKFGIVSGTNGYSAKTTNGGLNWAASNPGGSTTVGLALPDKNTWFTISDRNSNYEVWKKTDNITSISQNITMGIEGFWNGVTMVTDTVTVELHSATSPFGLVDQAKEVVNVNGYATYEFYSAPAGSYYIVLKHRNGLQTWSAAPVAMNAGGNYSYDFTTSAATAYGNNMVLKDGRYCIYSGDVNQDEVIDGSDGAIIDNDAFNFISGYVASDVNGDNIVDGSDASIWDNNAFNSVITLKP